MSKKMHEESKTLEDVRRWRKEAYEESLTQTLEQRAEEDARMARELGLRLLTPEELVKPEGRAPNRKAS